MAIYHCSIKIISRKSGRTAISAAAYRACCKLLNYQTGVVSDFTKKKENVHSEIILPEYAPQIFFKREKLWNSVEEIEKNSNAQLAREIEVALPKELTKDEQVKILKEYIIENFTSKGMIADFNIHDKKDGNPHCHILLTTRPLKKDGSWDNKQKKVYKLDENGQKIPVIDKKTGKQKIGANNRKLWERETIEYCSWNEKENAEIWRKSWADITNKYLEKNNIQEKIDHRSYERQGIDLEPTIHEGYATRKMAIKGIERKRIEHNKKVKEYNEFLKVMKELKEVIYGRIKKIIERIRTRRKREIEQRKREVERREQEIKRREQETFAISKTIERGKQDIERETKGKGLHFIPERENKILEKDNDLKEVSQEQEKTLPSIQETQKEIEEEYQEDEYSYEDDVMEM